MAFIFAANSSSVRAQGLLGVLELSRGGGRVDLVGGEGAVGQDGHDVITDLSEPAVDEVAMNRLIRPGSQLAVAQAADQGRAARQDAKLAVVEWQGDEIDRFIEERFLGSHHEALQPRVGGGRSPLFAACFGMTGHRDLGSQGQASYVFAIRYSFDIYLG